MPTTEAGRLMHDTEYGIGTCAAGRGCPMAQAIDAIEAEARAEGYAAGLAAAREAIEDCDEVGWDDAARSSDIHRAVALAAIDALSGSSSPHEDADLAVDP